jgi:hypothetical protein
MNLEEALKLYDKAKEKDLIGDWPKALMCVVEAYIEVNTRIEKMQWDRIESDNDFDKRLFDL